MQVTDFKIALSELFNKEIPSRRKILETLSRLSKVKKNRYKGHYIDLIDEYIR